jgi:hypothetical protein
VLASEYVRAFLYDTHFTFLLFIHSLSGCTFDVPCRNTNQMIC